MYSNKVAYMYILNGHQVTKFQGEKYTDTDDQITGKFDILESRPSM